MLDQDNLRIESGEESSDDPVVSFLYELMRDHLAPGVVSTIVSNSNSKQTTNFTNGYLAKYAKFLAKELKGNE